MRRPMRNWMPCAVNWDRKELMTESERKTYPKAIIRATKGNAMKLRMSEENVTLLKEMTTKGKTPSWAVRESAKISLILKGSLGRNLMILGKKRMMVSVAEKVSWNPTLKRLKGLSKSRKKALIEIVLMRLTFFQMSFPKRKASVMIVALNTEGLPSTRKA